MPWLSRPNTCTVIGRPQDKRLDERNPRHVEDHVDAGVGRLDQGVGQHLRRGDVELAGGGDVPA